jgi:diguanylate cyclase (GGDEF)-like protein
MHSNARKVLIADDDPAILRLLTHWLEAVGYEVRQANDGAEALQAVREDCPHFLITDWEMPNLDGIGLCRQIREEGLPHYVYSVLLTGRSDAGDSIIGLEAGADDLLTKPVSAPELLARLRAGARVVELENQLVSLARTDPLTGIPNRWVFFEHFERELLRASRYDLPLTCVLVDIDFFKTVNDTHGHVIGDVILKAFARALSQQCRPSDYICRYGGEEFCVLLTETSEENGAIWAERIRGALHEIAIPVGSQLVEVTASFGVAERHASTNGPEDLVDKADDALRVAKHTGRDRVVRFDEIGEVGPDSGNLTGYRKLFHGVLARHIMTTPVLCLNQDQTLTEAAELFLRVRINSAPVVDHGGRLVGIIAEKDLMASSPHTGTWGTPIHEVMTRHVVCYDENTPALVIYDFLCRVSIRRVVVVKDDRPTGVISRGSLLRWFGNWQVAGVSQPSTLDHEAKNLQAEVIRNRLSHTAAGLAQHVASLQEQLVENRDHPTASIVSQATRIQELANDLLACTQMRYEFAPADASEAADETAKDEW